MDNKNVIKGGYQVITPKLPPKPVGGRWGTSPFTMKNKKKEIISNKDIIKLGKIQGEYLARKILEEIQMKLVKYITTDLKSKK